MERVCRYLTDIYTGLTAVSANASIVWEANYEQFVLTDNSTGTSSTLTFLISPGSGTDISGLLGMTSTSSGAYVVNGHANIGKTILILYLMVLSAALHKWSWVIYSSENRTWSLRKKIMEFLVGYSLDIMSQRYTVLAETPR